MGDTLKVTGKILKPGSFLAKGKQRVSFSAEGIKSMFDKIEGSIPLVLGHVNGIDNVVIGYATKFGMDGEELFYKGYVFDEIDKITSGGYSGNSAEIIVDIADNGSVNESSLDRIAFVQDPSLGDTGIISQAVIELSKPSIGVKNMSEENIGNEGNNVGKDNEPGNAPKPPVAPVPFGGTEGNTVTNVVEKVIEKKVLDEEYKKKIEEMENNMKSVSSTLEQYRKKEVDAVVNEFKDRNMDVTELVSDMEAGQALEFLGKLKEGIAMKEASVKQTPKIPTDKKEMNAKYDEILRKLGLFEDAEIVHI